MSGTMLFKSFGSPSDFVSEFPGLSGVPLRVLGLVVCNMRMCMGAGSRVRSQGSIYGLCPYVGGFVTIKALDFKCIRRWGISIPVFWVVTHFLGLSFFFLAFGLGSSLLLWVDRDPGELLRNSPNHRYS